MKKVFKFYLELFRIKWILIILNKLQKSNKVSKKFSKILTKVVYYDKEVEEYGGWKNKLILANIRVKILGKTINILILLL